MNTQTKPKIELKAIKRLAAMSEETHCYSAKLYVDGELFGEVGNAGHGGCDEFRPAEGKSFDDLHNLNLRIKATFDPYEYEGGSLEYDIELLCGELVDAWLMEKDFKRWLKKPCFIADDGGITTYSLPKGMRLEAGLEQLRKREPSIEFLNDLPQADAFEALRKAA